MADRTVVVGGDAPKAAVPPDSVTRVGKRTCHRARSRTMRATSRCRSRRRTGSCADERGGEHTDDDDHVGAWLHAQRPPVALGLVARHEPASEQRPGGEADGDAGEG